MNERSEDNPVVNEIKQVLENHKNNVVAYVYGGFGSPYYRMPITVEVLYKLGLAVEHGATNEELLKTWLASLEDHPTWQAFSKEFREAFERRRDVKEDRT